MSKTVRVVIVGAGPYGLSIAAHLGHLGIEHRIIGVPMENWLNRMPKGMLLKSEGMASSLYDPEGRYSLRQYCVEHGIDYADLGLPVPIEVFAAYGLAFQRRFAPAVEGRSLTMLTESSHGLHLLLDDGEEILAHSVVIATGISHFHHIPPELAHLPTEFLTHSSEHHDLARFNGRDVTIIGAGASAIDLATLLCEGGEKVRLIARKPGVDIADKMELPRPLMDRIRLPMSGMGPSWRSLFYTEAPHVFHFLPKRIRLRVVKRHLWSVRRVFHEGTL